MKPLTYRDLLVALKELGEDQLELPVTIFNSDTNKALSLRETLLISMTQQPYKAVLERQFNEDMPLLVTL